MRSNSHDELTKAMVRIAAWNFFCVMIAVIMYCTERIV